MAIFKVGQRVRVVAFKYGTIDAHEVPIGAEGIVISALSPTTVWQYIVYLPNCMHSVGSLPPEHWGFDAEQLAPLTDPKADAFIESLKRLRYEEPRAPGKRDFVYITNPEELDKYRGGSQ